MNSAANAVPPNNKFDIIMGDRSEEEQTLESVEEKRKYSVKFCIGDQVLVISHDNGNRIEKHTIREIDIAISSNEGFSEHYFLNDSNVIYEKYQLFSSIDDIPIVDMTSNTEEGDDRADLALADFIDEAKNDEPRDYLYSPPKQEEPDLPF